jgi:hypothetical protein
MKKIGLFVILLVAFALTTSLVVAQSNSNEGEIESWPYKIGDDFGVVPGEAIPADFETCVSAGGRVLFDNTTTSSNDGTVTSNNDENTDSFRATRICIWTSKNTGARYIYTEGVDGYEKDTPIGLPKPGGLPEKGNLPGDDTTITNPNPGDPSTTGPRGDYKAEMPSPGARNAIQRSFDSVKGLFQKGASSEDGEARKAEMEEKRTQKRAALAEKAKERIRAYGERVVKRFDAALDRQDNLAERIESRIKKREEKDIAPGDEQGFVDAAKLSVQEARANLGTVMAQLEAIVNEEDQESRKSAFAQVKKFVGEIKEEIKSAHADLVDAIEAIRASIPDKPTEE